MRRFFFIYMCYKEEKIKEKLINIRNEYKKIFYNILIDLLNNITLIIIDYLPLQ